jgi:glycosyltransferase involved in cell wall biosynthesis
MKPKLMRITTVPISLKVLLKDQLKFMNQYFYVVGVSSKGKELSDVEKDEDMRTIELNMSREINPIKDFISLMKMIVLLLKEKPDIVHTHTPKAGIVGMVSAWITRVPHRLHTVAGLPVMEASGNKKKILLMVEKLTYLCATKVYPNSYGLQEYILENNLTDKDKLKVIGYGSSNGIDTSYFDRTNEVINQSKQIKEKYNLNNQFVFCFVGRVVKDKGINELLYAFDALTHKFTKTRLFIVGNLEEELNPISKQSHKILKENKNIINVGYKNDIRPYLASSDCFVLPTYREGVPNVVLQACSMELPCIVTDINGCNEIIEDRKHGLIIESKNKDELYIAMRTMLEEKGLSEQLGLNNRNDIIKKYDRKVFHQYLLKEYNRVLKND